MKRKTHAFPERCERPEDSHTARGQIRRLSGRKTIKSNNWPGLSFDCIFTELLQTWCEFSISATNTILNQHFDMEVVSATVFLKLYLLQPNDYVYT